MFQQAKMQLPLALALILAAAGGATGQTLRESAQEAVRSNPRVDVVAFNRQAVEQELARALEKQVIQRLMQLAGDSGVPSQVAAIALFKLSEQEKRLEQEAGYATDVEQGAHYAWLLAQVKRFREHPGEVKLPAPPVMPDGAPIGCDH